MPHFLLCPPSVNFTFVCYPKVLACSVSMFKKKNCHWLLLKDPVSLFCLQILMLSCTGSITGEIFHWMFLFAILCFTFSLSSWFGFSSVFLHLYWILISYYELDSLFHTAVFVLREKIILLNSASVILRKSFSPGNVMMGLVISGGAMLPWVVMWSVFAGVWPSEVIMFIKIVGGGGGSGAILSRLPLLFQVERCAEFRSD